MEVSGLNYKSYGYTDVITLADAACSY